MRRVTINDIAKQLKLSVCTVSKVLNGKPGISEATQKLVRESAKELGYRPNRLAEALMRRDLHILIVTNREWPQYGDELRKGVDTQIDHLRDYHVISSHVELSRYNPADQNARLLEGAISPDIDAIVLCGSAYSCELSPLPELLRESRRPVMLIGMDVPHIDRIGLVTHDAFSSGAVAAELLSTMVPGGDVAIMMANPQISDSQLKYDGFIQELSRRSMKLAEVMNTYDDPQKAREQMRDCLRSHPTLKGLYIATDNSASACEVVASSPIAGMLRVIATGVFPEVIHNFQTGIVHASLYQNMHLQGRLAIRLLYRYLVDHILPDPRVLTAPDIAVNYNWMAVTQRDQRGSGYDI